jgi:hypothetical protein
MSGIAMQLRPRRFCLHPLGLQFMWTPLQSGQLLTRRQGLHPTRRLSKIFNGARMNLQCLQPAGDDGGK